MVWFVLHLPVQGLSDFISMVTNLICQMVRVHMLGKASCNFICNHQVAQEGHMWLQTVCFIFDQFFLFSQTNKEN